MAWHLPLRCLREQMIHHSTSPTIRGVTRTCSKTVPFNCAIAHHRCRHPREPQRNGCGRGRPVGVCGMAARQRPPTANRPPERDIFCCSHRSARCAHADWDRRRARVGPVATGPLTDQAVLAPVVGRLKKNQAMLAEQNVTPTVASRAILLRPKRHSRCVAPGIRLRNTHCLDRIGMAIQTKYDGPLWRLSSVHGVCIIKPGNRLTRPSHCALASNARRNAITRRGQNAASKIITRRRGASHL